MDVLRQLRNEYRNIMFLSKQRKRLVNKDICLIASNCNGAMILHDLRLQFKSPFVNLWLRPKDFIKLLSSLREYMGYDLKFTTEEEIEYPVGLLKDIKIYFQHYKTEEEAKAALLQAEDSKKQAEEVYQKVLSEAKKAANAQKQAETLISRYQQEIPEQKKCVEDRKTSYTEVMEIKQMTESEWKELVETYSREAAEDLQKTVNAYNEKKTAAQARRDSAQNAVGESKRPVLEELQKEKEVAETEYLEKEKIYNQLRIDNKDDREIFDTLSSRLEERKSIVEEHARIDALYRMTSGNVSGSRMDLETYVQRYYLERILYAANRRFQEMSAGQFELRMYDLEKAGEGKNRGLDLMVYSTVTGKEREVRTLSGGESFMAALSLALGMADQIKQSSAAINLDMMFIDEGFGSLDEHSRNQAVRVLQEMAEGSRLIGIISHVSELKQEIEDQLIVTKDENGSHVKWQIS